MITKKTIPAAMTAVVLEAPRRLALREIPVWPIDSYGDPDLVLVRVEACGVCGSDFRYYAGENPWAMHTLGRHVENPPGIVLGHEYAGEVVAVADAKNEPLLGRRVAPVCSKVCGRCPDCRAGRTQLCPNTVHVAHQGRVQPGRPILMMGAGPAGNGIAQAARILGSSRVVIMDIADLPLEMAKKAGFDIVVDARKKASAALADELKTLAPEGFGSVFDSVGGRDSFDLGLSVLAKKGTLVNMAVHDLDISVNFLRLGSERRITTSSNFATGDYPIALSWLDSGRFQVKDWLSEVKLEDIPGLFAQADESG